jgi:hypothetical protein
LNLLKGYAAKQTRQLLYYLHLTSYLHLFAKCTLNERNDMTPEQKIHAKLKSQLSKLLPKGRWMLQRIETSTGSGVPDCYFACQRGMPSNDDQRGMPSNDDQRGTSHFNCWLETKTQEYKVTSEQINWSHAHALTGGKAWVVTECNKELRFLDYDDRMIDCSSLGVYIRRHSPSMLSLLQWLRINNSTSQIAEYKS